MRNKNTKEQPIAMKFDTKIGAIENKYGIKFGVRPDKKLGVFLRECGYKSLALMLQEA